MAKILVVEDDKLLSNAYRLKFTKAGHEVKLANDGKEALQIMSEFVPEIIVLDLIMPIKDGFSTLTDLKNDPNLKDIPVIIASNLGQDEDIKKCISMGAADFFIKSNISLEELVDKVEKILKT